MPQLQLAARGVVWVEKPPADAAVEEAANAQFDLLKYVVETEDYATGLLQQQALMTGTKADVLFGRNEIGGQNFHSWLDKILKTEDAELDELFKT